MLLFDACVSRVVTSELRAEKELGYVVMSFTRREWNALYWIVLVQTDRRMSLAEALVADFMADSVPREMEALRGGSRFQELCAGAVSSLRQPFASLIEQTTAHFQQIETLAFDFNHRLHVADLIESNTLSADDLIAFAKAHIVPKVLFGVLFSFLWLFF